MSNDNGLRGIIPEVCANCINKQKSEPVWKTQHYHCDVVGNYPARLFIWAQEQHYKTCSKFSNEARER